MEIIPFLHSFIIPFIRYCLSGSVAVIAHFSVLVVAVELFSANPTLSTALGFLCGTIVNYLLQYHWTFRATGKHHHVFLRYCIVNAFTMSLNVLIFWTLTELVGLWYFYSQFCATGVVKTRF